MNVFILEKAHFQLRFCHVHTVNPYRFQAQSNRVNEVFVYRTHSRQQQTYPQQWILLRICQEQMFSFEG